MTLDSTRLPSVLKIYAVLVLYKRVLEETQSYQSLMRAVENTPGISLTLLVYDNSPERQDIGPDPAGVGRVYRHDSSNGGLVSAYNLALANAGEMGCEWLLLLDQDTHLPSSYLACFLEAYPWLDSRVACVAPRVRVGGKIRSPRHIVKTLGTSFPCPPHQAGAAKGECTAINSASFVNVDYILRLGGYPTTYWLDAVDFWFCAALYRDEMTIFVLSALVDHELSTMDMASVPLDRWESIQAARSNFQMHMRRRPARFVSGLSSVLQSGGLALRGHEKHALISLTHGIRLMRSVFR